MKREKNTIDRMVKENEQLKLEKQRVIDNQNEENSRIETAIRELENKAFRNKQVADTRVAELDRRIEKNEKQIKLEAEYYDKIAKAIKGGKNE